jgi:hypothetical protein
MTPHVQVAAVNGTYGAGCSDRFGGWSLRMGESSLPLDHPSLRVLPNDADCVLTLTDLITSAGPSEAMLVNPRFDPPIALSDSWAKEHSRLMLEDSTFYANARIETTAVASDFGIALIVSDDAQGSLRVSKVTTPDYALNMEGAMHISLDAAKVVTSVAGCATLIEGAHRGDHYAIDLGTLSPSTESWSLEELRDAYESAQEHTIEGANPRIPAEQFGLVGKDMASGVRRTVIVSRMEDGVRSFQALLVTFKRPS